MTTLSEPPTPEERAAWVCDRYDEAVEGLSASGEVGVIKGLLRHFVGRLETLPDADAERLLTVLPEGEQ